MRSLVAFAAVCAVFVAVAAAATCPNFCYCDSIDGLNRANCSRHNLVSAQIGMSDLVEILDLSDNSIAVLHEQSFAQLRQLRVLLVASNYVHTIELDTFDALRRLRNLSLANNRLEWFDSRIVEPAAELQLLDLSGNKLMDIGNGPLVRSRSVRELRLRGAHITFVSALMLSELPALQRLDLSDNLLITLHSASFAPNRRLAVLNVVNNPFNCDGNLRATLLNLQRWKVEVVNWDCVPSEPPSRKQQKFERMVLATSSPPETTVAPTNTTTEADLRRVWRTIAASADEADALCPAHDRTAACDELRSCRAAMRGLRPTGTGTGGATSTRLASVKSVLYAGILIGALLGGCAIYVVMIVREGCASRRHRRRSSSGGNRLHRTYVIRERRPDSAGSDAEMADVPMMAVADDGGRMMADTDDDRHRSQAMTTGTRRRAPRRIGRATAVPPPRLGRRKTVYNWLFDRPAHRRYVRSMGQSTSNLVRRLSQSRLFLNFGAAPAPAAATTTTTTTTTPTADGRDVGDETVRRPDDELDTVVTVLYAPRMAHTWSGPTPAPTAVEGYEERPETPPPMYGDIVKGANSC